MTGAYLRVERDGKWQSIEVEYLTFEERAALFAHRDNAELMRWLNMLCDTLNAVRPEDGGKQDA